MRSRKILAVILIFCMAAGRIFCYTDTEKVQAFVSGDFTYEELADGTVSITYYGGTENVVTIPETLDGKQVTVIGHRAFYHTAIEEIAFPSSVTMIDSSAFYMCENLVKVTMPEKGMLHIGNDAFYECKNLEEITLSSELETIGEYAFQSCSKLRNIDIPSTVTDIGKYAFVYCSNLRQITIPAAVPKIRENTFMNCNSLTEVTFLNHPESIDGWAFWGCKSLTELRIPDSVKMIGKFAFEECRNLKDITLPSGLTNIDEGAFETCISLTKIDISKGVTSIATGLFKECKALTEISIPEGVTEIGESAFSECTSLTDVYYAGTLDEWEKITISEKENESLFNATMHYNSTPDGSSAYYEYEELVDGTIEITEYIGSDTEVIVPDMIDGKQVTSIGPNAFLRDNNLETITIPASIKKLADIDNDILACFLAFCENLRAINVDKDNENFSSEDGVLFNKQKTKLIRCPQRKTGEYVIPSSVTDIGIFAFSQCSGLTNISMASGVTSIGYGSFGECSSLSSISIPASMQEIGDLAFYHCNLAEVYYSGTKEQWNKMVIAPDGNDALQTANKYYMENGYEYEFHDGTVRITAYKGMDEDVKIPAELDGKPVTSIGLAAFQGRTDIRAVSMPDSMTEIGVYAFAGCTYLTEVLISPNVTSIGNLAFSRCSSLEKINIPDSVTNIGAYAFRATSMKEAALPAGLTAISTCIFAECKNLEKISFSENVVKISSAAFLACGNLKEVYYSGSKEQWDEIDINSDGNEMLLNAVIYFKENPPVPNPEEVILPATVDAHQELERLKSGDKLLLEKDFQQYLSDEQIGIIESGLYTWLAEINYAYKYSENTGIKERIMKKTGIDPQGDFASGAEQAIIHISVETKYGTKTFEITLNLGKPDSSGNLYPAYGTMHYEVLEKEGLPSDVPTSGQIGTDSYADMGTFIECISRTSADSLHSIYQWELLDDGMASGVLVDKTVTEIIGNKNGSFSDGSFTIYAKPLFTYSKKVTISCPVDVHVYSMDGKEAGSVVNNQANGGDQYVRFDVNGDVKSVFLTGNDYYINLRGTDTGTMKYEVEEIANDKVRRNVQFLELQLQKDMQYEGYVFRPLNIDSSLYALRTVGGSSQEVFYADADEYYETLSVFRRVQGLSLSQKATSLDANKTIQLSASLSPLDASNPNLRWSTDNEAIAKVDGSGLVTAVGAGRATVTVATKDGSFLKQFCVIDVADKKGGTGSSSGWYGGSTAPSVEQGKDPVVVNLHYVLQFQINGGTSLSRRTMTLLADDSPGIMPKAGRKGYTFNGWYTQQEGGTKVAGDKPLKEAVTLYAQWTKIEAPAKPAAPTLKSKKKGQVQVAFKTVSGAAGYQVEYSTDKKFASVKVKEAGASAKSKTIAGLKAGKKYYVRMRAYRVDSMKNRIYGAYSSTKSVEVKG